MEERVYAGRQSEQFGSVAERLRAWGPIPIAYVGLTTIASAFVVLSSDFSRVWLLASVLVLGAVGFLIFSMKFWRR
jgi:hypothetical protein